MTAPDADKQKGSRMQQYTCDILGIGFGPANLSLAIALEEDGLSDRALFLEKRMGPTWQPGMLLDGTDIQNNPLRDLVTLRNPLSRYTFTNYLHTHERLLPYLNLGLQFPLRKEFARYIEWVSGFFGHQVRYGRAVRNIAYDHDRQLYRVGTTTTSEVYLARALVIGTGRTPLIPDAFKSMLSERVFHLNDYLPKNTRQVLKNSRGHVCVIGASQSAIEIVIDLYTRYPHLQITNLIRGFGYQLKDTSPFSEHVYFPEFIDYFFEANAESKRTLTDLLRRTNYSSADADVIHRLYLMLYEQNLDGESRLNVRTNTDVVAARTVANKVELTLREMHRGDVETLDCDWVILGTGFRNLGGRANEERYPSILEPIADLLEMNGEGTPQINRDYSLASAKGSSATQTIFLNGLCESSHGLGDAGSFSLLAQRGTCISRALASRLQLVRSEQAAEVRSEQAAEVRLAPALEPEPRNAVAVAGGAAS